ncbi:MAG: septin family protein [Ruminococcus flavefaciens]|nr:septin family protein [Ruminococcus flavefaciens]
MENIMSKIVGMVNEDDEGLKRYLQATPYNDLDYYNFNGLVDSGIFRRRFYVESGVAAFHKKRLCSRFTHPGGKNTIFIVGYQGSGKTTFINTLIEDFFKSKKINSNQRLLIDCDKYGVAAEKYPLKTIFLKIFMSYIKKNENHLDKYCDFFQENFVVFDGLGNFLVLNEFCNMIRELLKNTKESLNQVNIYIKWENKLNDFSLKDILYLINLLFISSYFDSQVDYNPILLFIDNLDYIDSYSELSQFMMAFDDFTIDMSRIFSHLKLYRNSDVKFRYVDKMKIIIAMRETTRANLPRAHFSDAFNAIYEPYDLSEWYNKNDIAIHRIEQIQNETNLEYSKKMQAELIKSIMRDSYTKNIFIPLFNNNYRSAVGIITKIVKDNQDIMIEYSEIMNRDESFKYGARGILYKLILDEFNISEEGEENCFKRIGVLDLLGRKNNDVSYPRLILSYLSNYTETRCDDAKNCVKVSQILKDFSGILDKENIIRSIWNMFDLKNSRWTHLISFCQLERKNGGGGDSLDDITDLYNVDFEKTTIHYSCAGKIYLEYVASHFEFFTTRINGALWKPLYSKENVVKDKENGQYKFILIIESVFTEVKKCCESLRKFNKKLCSVKNWSDPYTDNKKYSESPYICQLKKTDGRVFKRFHEERIIIRHIGYIDDFRIYILKYGSLLQEEKPYINKRLVEIIKKYVSLLEGKILLCTYTKDTLLPYYQEKIAIYEKDNMWENYSMKIGFTNEE